MNEFTIAPEVNPSDKGRPFHEWFIDFESQPLELSTFVKDLDLAMRKQNIYYDDLISGNILRPLKLNVLKSQAFRDFMREKNMLGGQNKIPHLRNDRKIADDLKGYINQSL